MIQESVNVKTPNWEYRKSPLITSRFLSGRFWIHSILAICLVCIVAGTSFSKPYGPGHVLVCGDTRVLLVDQVNSANEIPNIVWSWDARLADDLPEDFRLKRFNSIDDCKATADGSQILVSSSSGAISVVNVADKKVTFYAEVPNAHSIEILPGNLIVAAASTNPAGNRLMLFDLRVPGKLLFSDSLYSAHGVVWDKNRNTFFALGYDVLREYSVNRGVALSLINEWKIPGISGHDLMMAPCGTKLFLTEHTGAWIFDIATQKFGKIEGFPDAENIKSINQNKSGRYVFTVPEESWWTYHVSLFNPEARLAFPGMKVYKARWFNPND